MRDAQFQLLSARFVQQMNHAYTLSCHCTCIILSFILCAKFLVFDIRRFDVYVTVNIWVLFTCCESDHLRSVGLSFERGDCCWSSEANIRKMCFYSVTVLAG